MTVDKWHRYLGMILGLLQLPARELGNIQILNIHEVCADSPKFLLHLVLYEHRYHTNIANTTARISPSDIGDARRL